MEIEADLHAKCKPGAAKTPNRIVSTSCSVLARRCGLPPEITYAPRPNDRSGAQAPCLALCRAYASRFTPFPTVESGFKAMGDF